MFAQPKVISLLTLWFAQPHKSPFFCFFVLLVKMRTLLTYPAITMHIIPNGLAYKIMDNIPQYYKLNSQSMTCKNMSRLVLFSKHMLEFAVFEKGLDLLYFCHHRAGFRQLSPKKGIPWSLDDSHFQGLIFLSSYLDRIAILLNWPKVQSSLAHISLLPQCKLIVGSLLLHPGVWDQSQPYYRWKLLLHQH